MQKYRSFSSLMFILLLSLLSGCSPLSPLSLSWFTITSVETSGPTEPIEEFVHADGCPEATEDLQRLVVEREGYCTLYPNQYTVEQPSDGITILIVGGLLDADHARAHIEVEDALGRTAEDAAMAVSGEFENTGIDVELSSGVSIGGAVGWQVDNVPGQDINRQVFAVHDGRLYRFLFAPADPARPQAYEVVEELYRTVIHSFTFIPPTAPTGIPLPPTVDDQATLVWEGYTDLVDGDVTQCKLLTITWDDEVHYGLCGEADTVAIAEGYVPLHWNEIKVRFAPFFYEGEDYEDEVGTVSFQGSGDVEGKVWQRAIAAYARTSYGEAAAGRVGASVRTAMSWWLGDVPDQPGFCRHLVVLDYGYAYANVDPCEGGEMASTAGGWLETSEMEGFDALLYGRAPVYQEDNYFTGRGEAEMSVADIAALSQWAEAVYTRIVGTTAP